MSPNTQVEDVDCNGCKILTKQTDESSKNIGMPVVTDGDKILGYQAGTTPNFSVSSLEVLVNQSRNSEVCPTPEN